MVYLVADSASVTVLRSVASTAYGNYNLNLPDGINLEDIHQTDAPGNQLGYVSTLTKKRVGRFFRRFIRADVNITAADPSDPFWVAESNVDEVLREAEERVAGDFFLESDISKAGLGAWRPFVDFNVGDIVAVEIWGQVVYLPVTRIEPIISDHDIIDWKVHVGGQLISNDDARIAENKVIYRALIEDRRELVNVSATARTANKKAETADSKAETADRKAETADSKAEGADKKAEEADSKAQGAQETADTADRKAEDAQKAVDTVATLLDPIMDFGQSYMPTGLGFNDSGRLPFRAQRGPAKGVRIESNGMRLLGQGAWQITCEVTASWVRLATRRIIYRINCYNPQGDLYAYQEFIDDTSNETHTVAFGADFVLPGPNYFVAVHVTSVGIGRKHLGGWAATRLVAKRWSSEFINPPDGGSSETETAPD